MVFILSLLLGCGGTPPSGIAVTGTTFEMRMTSLESGYRLVPPDHILLTCEFRETDGNLLEASTLRSGRVDLQVPITSTLTREGDTDTHTLTFQNANLPNKFAREGRSHTVSNECKARFAGMAFSPPANDEDAFFYASTPDGEATVDTSDVTEQLLGEMRGATFSVTHSEGMTDKYRSSNKRPQAPVEQERSCFRVYKRTQPGVDDYTYEWALNFSKAPPPQCEFVSAKPCEAHKSRAPFAPDQCCAPQQRWTEQLGCHYEEGVTCFNGEPGPATGCPSGPTEVGQPTEDLNSPILGTLKSVPAGTYITTMKALHYSKQQQRDVAAFHMMESEVTHQMWTAVMGTNPSMYSDCGPTCPVESVSYDDAVAFAAKLSATEGVTYRLPSEHEWEWAARGGEAHIFAGSADVDAVAWHRGNTKTPKPVCTKQRNGFGLCDMSGNVWEWTADIDASQPNHAKRGGSWFAYPLHARVFSRGNQMQPFDDGLGLRLVREAATGEAKLAAP